MPVLIPQKLTGILNTTDLTVIVAKYDPVALGQLLPLVLVTQYPPISPYLGAIGKTLYPEFKSQPAGPLAAADRERCLVALLASRSRRIELAIHIYMGLGNKIEPEELAHIVLAAGIYTGVDTVANGFAVMQGTLETLQVLVAANTVEPKDVLPALAVAIP